jgi:hypothetical protein
MRVYELGSDVEHYRSMGLATKRAFWRWHQRFDGTPLKRYWTGKEKFKYDQLDLPKGDTPGTLPGIAFSLKAVIALADFLEPNGELIQIRCQKDTLFLYNVTRLVDALDEENCDVDRFDDGRIMFISRYSFFEDRLHGEVLFRLPRQRLWYPCVTDPFVLRVKEAGLKGFRFRLVWSTEEELDPNPAAAIIITT